MKIGCVPYLNAKPLIEGLVGVFLEPPADLVKRLAAGKLDVGAVQSGGSGGGTPITLRPSPIIRPM